MGFGVIEVSSSGIALIIMDVLKLSSRKDAYERLQLIHQKVCELVKHHAPHALAIEAPFFGKNVQSMLKLGRAQGVAIAAAMHAGVPVTEYSPRKIKQENCRSRVGCFRKRKYCKLYKRRKPTLKLVIIAT